MLHHHQGQKDILLQDSQNLLGTTVKHHHRRHHQDLPVIRDILTINIRLLITFTMISSLIIIAVAAVPF